MKVLALSNDPSTLDQLKTWADQDQRHQLHTAHSLEELNRLPDLQDVDAIIVDEDSPGTQLQSFMNDLLQRSDRPRVILLRSQGNDSVDQAPDAVFMLQKPFSVQSLDAVLSKATGEDVQSASSDHSTQDEKPELADEQEDLSYLKGWIEEDPPDNEALTEVAISEEPDIELAGSDTASEGETPTEGLDVSEAVGDQPDEDTQPIMAAIPDAEADEAVADAQPEEEKSSPLYSYNCVLIPRNEEHYLTRGIAERLGLILPWIHASRGWRLTGIAIRPTYVQWSIALPIENNPIAVINEIKRLTSDQLFATFSELRDNEEGTDFWAPGYLMISGEQSTAHTLVTGFMEFTRQLQKRGTVSP